MIFYTVLVLMFLGSTLVFYSLSPYYGALGLVLVALSGCLLCSLLGFSFIALVLILIYVGGMLVVFVYSTAISAERYPSVSNFNEILVLSSLVISWGVLNFDPLINVEVNSWGFVTNSDLVGASNLYSSMGGYLLIGGYILLVALVVALVLTYGSDYSILKAL
uniref:NADH-ubiquinone oxidoreductase chain 6 n=1 Tax=Patiria pectinifera TaxID=7594 RepID=NU6M_PATPE|nr:NADH dehydrogenase subunit 6 [Patiria pectinifera]Q33817.1 RecName: Full=NADH-ubiquinone oxidoreductase chain 6; AltName: Full=NADH dehydrogenase subunit 6 [Patiria pectinifera]BAA03876.1 NADH-dehydrogenase subunit 6 [Patiria pectinifera]